MGKFTIERWACDRCKRVMEDKPLGASRVVLIASYHYRTGPGPDFSWTEMCEPCQGAIETLIEGALRQAALATKETSAAGYSVLTNARTGEVKP